jgi:hypothetical protein
MTFTDCIVAMIITSLFFTGFARAALPVYTAWQRTYRDYRTARDIAFVADSFRRECAESDRNVERWKRAVAAVPNLELRDITEYKDGSRLRALRLTCVIAGEPVEVIGVCTP